MNQLIVAVPRSEKLVAEAGNRAEAERPPLEATTKQRLIKTEDSMSGVVNSDLWNV
jgi:hypothetical protein